MRGRQVAAISVAAGCLALATAAVAYTDSGTSYEVVTVYPQGASSAFILSKNDAIARGERLRYSGAEPSWLDVRIDTVVAPERHPEPEADKEVLNDEAPVLATDEETPEPDSTPTDEPSTDEPLTADEPLATNNEADVLVDADLEPCPKDYDSRDFAAPEDVDPFCLTEPKVFLTSEVLQSGDIAAGYTGDTEIIESTVVRVDAVNRPEVAKDIASYEVPMKAWLLENGQWVDAGSSSLTERFPATFTLPAGKRFSVTVERGGKVVPISDTDGVSVSVDVALKVMPAPHP